MKKKAEQNDSYFPLLLSDAQAARMIGISRRTFRTHNAVGKTPPPLRLGGLTRWNRDVLLAWVQMGCPSRERFAEREGGG